MSKSDSGDDLWADLTDAQKLEVVRHGEATLKQLAAGLLDGSEDLRRACRDCLSHTDASLAGLFVPDGVSSPAEHATEPCNQPPETSQKTARESKGRHRKFGLPEGYVPRLQRFGRNVLLEKNIYLLPNSCEYIPCEPIGGLDQLRYLYILLTPEEYVQNKRGSTYVRTDGRIFDYSLDTLDSERELFDTGYTIYDLKRTGRYAPRSGKTAKSEKSQPRKSAFSR